MSTFATSAELGDLAADKRVNYSLGMIVGADDFRQDQRYLMARDDKHQTALHGWGVVSGLVVDISESNELQVHPGMAVDGVGQSICVDTTQCADLLAWFNSHADDIDVSSPVEAWVLLCYATCETDLLPVPSGPCRSLEDSLAPSRVIDSFSLELTLDEPAARNDTAHPNFGAIMTGLVDDAATEPDRRERLAEFIAGRGVDPAFADLCLNADGVPCVPIARVRATLDLDGSALVFTTDPPFEVDTAGRPIMLSSSFLQEWLLRVDGGGVITVEPDLSVFELNDTASGSPADAAPDPASIMPGSVLKWDRDERFWMMEQLNLDLLEDVDTSLGPMTDNSYLGWDRTAERWIPKFIPPPTTPPPTVIDGPYVRAREDSLIGLVAAGVIEFEFRPGDGAAPRFEDSTITDAGFRTEYGGLSLDESTAFGNQIHGVFRVSFPGLAEAIDRYPELEGRQFVVKALGEETYRAVIVQVVHIDSKGIVLRYQISPRLRPDEQGFLDRLLKDQFEIPDDLDPEETHLAIHIEISVFDDKETDSGSTEHLREVEALWEPVG